MFGIKFTAILLITAVFNPLCCCLDLTAKEAEPAHPSKHSCCTNAQQDAGKNETGRHTQADCPHNSEKNSQISQTSDSHDSLAKSQISQAAFLYAIDFFQRENAREATTPPYPLDRTSSPPPSPVLEDYCVYIL